MNLLNEFLRKLLFLPAAGVAVGPRRSTTSTTSSSSPPCWAAWATLATATGLRLPLPARSEDEQTTPIVDPKPIHEAVFIGLPLVLFLAWFAIGYPQYVRLQTPPKGAIDVYVQGKKWMWKFAYPGGPNSTDVLRVPAGRPVRLLLTSRDVIHSFYVPALRLKQDALPGPLHPDLVQRRRARALPHLLRRVLRPRPLGHAGRAGGHAGRRVGRLDGAAAARQPAPGPGRPRRWRPRTVDLRGSLVEQGRRIAAVQGCFKCHTVDGTQHIGPTWLDLYGRTVKLEGGKTIVADEAYLTRSMMEPNAEVVAGYKNVMPTYQGKLTPRPTPPPSSSSSSPCGRTLRPPSRRRVPIYVPVTGK